jgi:hypothetical protein
MHLRLVHSDATAVRAARFSFTVTCLFLITLSSPGQLAITEVMAKANTNAMGRRYPDYWELTNFGTNTNALDEYIFSDSRGLFDGMPNITFFSGKHIGPGESMVLVRTNQLVSTGAQFRAWWGETNLPPALQVYFYPEPGINDRLDAVQLFRVTASSTTLVDRVEVIEAPEGSTLTYHPDTAAFGVISVAGQYGAFKAATAFDVGSPGFTTGPVPLRLTVQPQSVDVDAGSSVTFGVQYQGLPKPRFQWRYNGAPISNAVDSALTISPALPRDAGDYSVELTNGLTNIVSLNATLTVNTNASCARIAGPLIDTSIYTNQTARFNASVRGYPVPAVQWQFNGTNIPNATNAALSITNVTFASAGVYTIRVSNPSCTNTASARLFVTTKPFLRVTETMSNPSTNTSVGGHDDWWELTNFETNSINLRGYRFNDDPGPSFEGAYVITNDVIIQPGESIIFARNMSAEAFKNWWGEENLPENIRILTYPSHNFEPATDSIYFWNAAAADLDDRVAWVNFTNPTNGVTLWFDPSDPVIELYGEQSKLGERGTIRAVEADDIGSPGYRTNHPARVYAPRFTEIIRSMSGVRLTWTARPGKTYELQSATALTTDAVWSPVNQQSSTGFSVTLMDSSATNASRRFYRLQVLPDAP